MFQPLRSSILRCLSGGLHGRHHSSLNGERCVVKKTLLSLTVASLGINPVQNNLRTFGSLDESSKSSEPSGKRRKGRKDNSWSMGRLTGRTSRLSKDVEIHPGFKDFEDMQVKEGNQPIFGKWW